MEEMLKLISKLNRLGAEFKLEEVEDLKGFKLTLYRNGREVDDCIWNKYSHGYEDGLLESYHLHSCIGYETAEDIFEGWYKLLERR